MLDLKWHGMAWSEYLSWQTGDRRALKKINLLLDDMRRHPFTGLGKPEPLRHDMAGLWSRRINNADRITYYVKDETLIIISCKNHYG